jgi:DNA-binding CsgD family transcriptional regulator
MGSLEQAAEHVRASSYSGATEEEELRRGYLATVRAELAIAQGLFEEALRLVAATAPRVAGTRTYMEMTETTWWLVALGLDAAAALAETASAAKDGRTVGEMQDVAKVLTGHIDRARRLRETSGMPEVGTLHGYDALIAGHIARIEGRNEPSLWAASAAEFPPHSVETLTARYRQAEAMLAIKAPREEIKRVMVEAHEAAVEIGARPLADRFEALARRARIEFRPARSTTPAEEGGVAPPELLPPGTAALRARGLSDREIEVLTLVAAGFSNGEIGERLFIARKTAAVHVTHILDKLDVASRTEAATIGVRLGLPELEQDDAPY